MKKTFLSLALILTFAGYAFYTRVIGTNVPVALAPEPNKPKSTLNLPIYTPATILNNPPTQPPVVVTPKPIPTPTPIVNTGKFKNGSYTGDIADAYYGNVQVRVVISGGKITDVQFLDYPHDRQTSQLINSRAMPYLISEAISIQDSNVDGVSGASFTSEAFRQSLASALTQA